MKMIYSGCDDTGKVGKIEWGSGHLKLIKDFYSCINTGKSFMIDSVAASESVADLLAVYESSLKGEKVIIENFLKG